MLATSWSFLVTFRNSARYFKRRSLYADPYRVAHSRAELTSYLWSMLESMAATDLVELCNSNCFHERTILKLLFFLFKFWAAFLQNLLWLKKLHHLGMRRNLRSMTPVEGVSNLYFSNNSPSQRRCRRVVVFRHHYKWLTRFVDKKQTISELSIFRAWVQWTLTVMD